MYVFNSLDDVTLMADDIKLQIKDDVSMFKKLDENIFKVIKVIIEQSNTINNHKIGLLGHES